MAKWRFDQHTATRGGLLPAAMSAILAAIRLSQAESGTDLATSTLTAAMRLHAAAEHPARQHVERGKQRRGVVAGASDWGSSQRSSFVSTGSEGYVRL